MNSRGEKRIQYAIDLELGMVWSKYENQLAIPILDFAGMKPENNWQMNYNLEKCSIDNIRHAQLKWTRKIPIEIKNLHRQFWGMKSLKSK